MIFRSGADNSTRKANWNPQKQGCNMDRVDKWPRVFCLSLLSISPLGIRQWENKALMSVIWVERAQNRGETIRAKGVFRTDAANLQY